MTSPERRTPPIDPELAEIRKMHQLGLEFQKADLADPVRGPIWNRVRSVYEASLERQGQGDEALANELNFFLAAFAEAVPNARSYRLYHALIGSTPDGSNDQFDIEGPWSIEEKMDELREKYGIT